MKKSLVSLKKKLRSQQKKTGELRRQANDYRRILNLKISKKDKKDVTKRLEVEETKIAKQNKLVSTTSKAIEFQKLLRKFKVKKSDRNKFIFVTTKGKRSKSSKAKGVYFQISARGKVRVVREKVGSDSLYHRGEISLVSRVRGEKNQKAAMKAEGRFKKDVVRGKHIHNRISNPKNPYSWLGKNIAKDLVASFNDKRNLRHVIVEVRLRAYGRKNRKRVEKNFIIRVGFDLGQIANIRNGISGFVQNTVWQQVSTELAMEDCVTVGSARRVKQLKDDGEDFSDWGKGKYTKINIEHAEYEFYIEQL